MADLKASPQNQTLGALARMLTSARDRANQYQVLPQVPLLGGTGLGDLFMGKAPEEVTEWSYGNAPMFVPQTTRIPRFKKGRAESMADTLFLGADAAGLAPLAKAAGKTAGRAALGRINEAMLSGQLPASPSFVVKPKGGNWLAGSVDTALDPIVPRTGSANKTARDTLEDMNRTYPADVLETAYPETRAQVERAYAWLGPNLAIQDWVEKKLAKYVQNELATPEDPLRAMAERGVLHFDPHPEAGDAQSHLAQDRAAAGYPEGGMGVSDLARRWENLADYSVQGDAAGNLLNDSMANYVEANPWLEKVPPQTRVYQAPFLDPTDLGFEHMVDELKNAMDPNSGLPRNLQIQPKDLQKISVPQAAERVAKINEWRAAQKIEANKALANNAATVLHKEYPEQGYRWVELKTPDLPEGWKIEKDALGVDILHGPNGQSTLPGNMNDPRTAFLRDALKYEGDTMGHCVGGYCDDVASGKTRIYSLRDAKGEPHVTIEVRPPYSYRDRRHLKGDPNLRAVSDMTREEFNHTYYVLRDRGLPSTAVSDQEKAAHAGYLYHPDYHSWISPDSLESPVYNIIQIKGKQNRAPKEEYLPFVQDFVKSGQWGDVRELDNAGLRRVEPASDLGTRLREAGVDVPPYVTESELTDLLDRYGRTSLPPSPEGFASGGLVEYNPAEIEELASRLYEEING